MNKLRAKVKLISKEDSSYLIKAFFQEFNVENSILIKENEATIEFSFDEIPEALIKAIYHCEIIELEFVGQKERSDTAVNSIAISNLDNKRKGEKTIEIPNLDDKGKGEIPKKKRGRPPKNCIENEKKGNEEKKTPFEKLRKIILKGDNKDYSIGERAMNAFGRIEANVHEGKGGEDYDTAIEFDEISRVLNTAALKQVSNWKNACISSNIPEAKITELELSLSKILNDFMKKNGEKTKIKVEEFMKILIETLREA